MKVVIYSPFRSPRLSYIAQWLEYRWEIEVGINTKVNQGDVIISYGGLTHSNDCITIPSSGLLESEDVISQKHSFSQVDGLNVLFLLSVDEYDFSFDFFSMSFYLLSRYEEYVGDKRDKHNRWISDQAVAVQHNFIDTPIIDLWLKRIEHLINTRFKVSFRSSNMSSVVPTIDIDLPYAYKKKSWKNIAALLRDTLTVRRSKVLNRINYLKTKIDPFDQYEYLLDQLKLYPETLFFFLCRYEKPYDENHLSHHTLFKNLVIKISNHHTIGLHPSYSSYDNPSYLKEEQNLLSSHSNQKIVKSRQHFLRFNLPSTYRNLIEIGIDQDHSMMYPDRLGFRASTAHPFFWYDLLNERSTSLMIHSPCLMDVTLKDYCNLSPDEAQIKIDQLKASVREVGGRFEFIWHNSSFSELHGWRGWQKVFEYLLSD